MKFSLTSHYFFRSLVSLSSGTNGKGSWLLDAKTAAVPEIEMQVEVKLLCAHHSYFIFGKEPHMCMMLDNHLEACLDLPTTVGD